MIVGLLPASGSASRVKGIPKFCLPISDDICLLEWHVKNMAEVCDEIRISTKSSWLPIVQKFNIDAKINIIEPSTMSDAITKMIDGTETSIIIGMPDTFISHTNQNFYKTISDSEYDITLASWPCNEDIKGRVGQINYNGNDVIEVIDKVPGCEFDRMWGALKFNISGKLIDPALPHPGVQLNSFIRLGYTVGHIPCEGEYIDAGTVSGIKELYRSI